MKKAEELKKLSEEAGFLVKVKERFKSIVDAAEFQAKKGCTSYETTICAKIHDEAAPFIKMAEEEGFSITYNSVTGSARTVDFIVLNW